MDLIMRKGSHGSEVQALQVLLNKHGAKLAVNGMYDDATVQAVVLVQRTSGLVVDGIAGKKTLGMLRGQQNTKRLKEADLIAAADKLGVQLACIKAVNRVESRGSGFMDDGRVVILLERHIAYRRTKEAGLDAPALAAKYPNLINQERGGYAGGPAEWARFENLRSVTSQAVAVEACSWGLFQVMGFNWADLGYASAADFKTAMMESEAQQLDAFVRFIEADPALLKALKSKKWADFARRYNGPAFAENCYDAKLAAAFDAAERLTV